MWPGPVPEDLPVFFCFLLCFMCVFLVFEAEESRKWKHLRFSWFFRSDHTENNKKRLFSFVFAYKGAPCGLGPCPKTSHFFCVYVVFVFFVFWGWGEQKTKKTLVSFGFSGLTTQKTTKTLGFFCFQVWPHRNQKNNRLCWFLHTRAPHVAWVRARRPLSFFFRVCALCSFFAFEAEEYRKAKKT